MKSDNERQARAQACMRKAETAAHAADRAGWMQLAEDWMTLSNLTHAAPDVVPSERAPSRIDRIGWLKRLLRG